MDVYGILSLIFGILGILSSYWYVGIVPCAIGAALGIMGLIESIETNKSPIAMGLLLSILGGVMSVFFIVSDLDSGALALNAKRFGGEMISSTKDDDFMRFHKEESSPDKEDVEIASNEPMEETTDNKEEKPTPYWIHDSEKERKIEEPSQMISVEQEKMDSESDDEKLYSENDVELDKQDEPKNKDNLLEILQDILGENTGNKTFDILVNQIGFTDVAYIGKNSVGTNNFDFTSNECDFTVTAFENDDVYRIFRPNNGTVFYENGEIKNTIEDYESKKINSDDEISYYIIAQEIVSGTLKNPKSAKFPSIVTHPEEIAMQRSGNIVAVKSYVESKNDFGLDVRNDWLVEFEIADIGTYSYNLLYANIGGEKIGEFIELN